MPENKSFFSYLRDRCFRENKSIFLGNLVAGLFLGYLLDRHDRCNIGFFTEIFFAIGISHVLFHLLNEMLLYSRVVAKYDSQTTKLELGLQWFVKRVGYLLTFIQCAAYLCLGAFIFYSIYLRNASLLTVYEKDQCRTRRQETFKANTTTWECRYCELSTINLGTFVFSFQTLYAAIVVLFYLRMWRVDARKSNTDVSEEAEWMEYERNLKGTVLGFLKEGVDILGLRPFFGLDLSKVLLSVSIALPTDSCHASVTTWYMVGAVVSMLSDIQDELILRVETKAQTDGYQNWDEFRTVFGLKVLKFATFLVELCVYFAVSIIFLQDMGRSQSTNKELPYFCGEKINRFNSLIFIVYTFVLLFRIMMVVAAYFPPNDGAGVQSRSQSAQDLPAVHGKPSKQPEKAK